MLTLEKDIEKALIDAVRAAGGRCLKWVCPGWAGVPDRIILLPGGVVKFVETKKPKTGVLSARQKKWHEILLGLGFSCWVVWSWSDLAAWKAANL